MNDIRILILLSTFGIFTLFGFLTIINRNFELQNQLEKLDRVDPVFESSLEKTIEQRVQERCKE